MGLGSLVKCSERGISKGRLQPTGRESYQVERITRKGFMEELPFEREL